MSDPSTVPTWAAAPARPPAPAVPVARTPISAPRPASSWWGDPAPPRPSPVGRPALPSSAKPAGSSWLSTLAPTGAPAAVLDAPVPAEPLAETPKPLPVVIKAAAKRTSGAAPEDVSAELDPEPIEASAANGSEPAATPVFPLVRTFDNRPSRNPEPAGAERPGRAIIETPTTLPPDLGEAEPDILDEAAAAFAAASKSEATRRAYRANLRQFGRWCRGEGVEALPATPRTVVRYLTALAGLGRSVSTVDQHAAAIGYGHRLAGYDAPTVTEEVRAVLTGIRNSLGRPPVQKKALTDDLVAKVVRKIPRDLVGLRDRAMILLCFAAALRRSELVALEVRDLEWGRRGLVVTVRKSKTDQAGKGKRKGVPDGKLKVPDAVRAWLDATGITDGPVFRGCDRGRLAAKGMTGTWFARVVKMRCEAVGLDPDAFSGHSCRRGFATSADEHGADLKATAEHMAHAKVETTMCYMETGDLFRKNPGKAFV